MNNPADTGFDPGKTPVQYGGGPFNRVTNACLSSTQELYVADGYGNARVHKFTSALEYEFSWGEPGTGPGEFRLPHAIVVDTNDRVLVADRENARIQVFTSSGEYITEWNNVIRPDDLFIDIDAEGILYVAELGQIAGRSPDVEILPHMPHARVSLLDLDGNIIHRFGGADPVKPRSFFAPHWIWADSIGNLDVAEVVYSGGANRGLVPLDCHSLQNFRRIIHE